jgi:aspartate kinase
MARRIGVLSYEETQEMAESGAKVLNAQAVEFAKERGIAIYARATSGAPPGTDPSADGTVVRRNPPRVPGTVVGVASERDVLVLESDAGAEEMLSALDEYHVSGKQLHISTDTAHATLVVSRENLHDEAAVQRAFHTRFGDRVRFASGLGAVSAIGAGINATYANVRAGLSVLRDAGVPCHGLSTSSFRITWMVPAQSIDGASRALHARFVESVAPLVP